VTPSIGISLFPDHGRNAEALIQAADSAMYAAKQGGRNTCVTFRPDIGARP
jgi:diguanylate cyclase (GGDEF)-like protein